LRPLPTPALLQMLSRWSQVNASPSLSATTHTDRLLKGALINHILNIVVPPDFMEGKGGSVLEHTSELGDFELLYDEQALAEAEKGKQFMAEEAKKSGSGKPRVSASKR
jgi:hypothetical protein